MDDTPDGGGPDEMSGEANQTSVSSGRPATDPLFPPVEEDFGDGLFRNKDLLQIRYVPQDDNRIVGRDEEIQKVADEIGVVANDEAPNNIGVYGKTGTGKSLVVRHVVERAEATATDRGVSIGTVYIDCSDATTKTKVAKSIGRQMDRKYDLGIDIPRRGLGADDYFDYLWHDVLPNFDHALIVLDEVDGLQEVNSDSETDGEGILYMLSRAEEKQFTDCNLGIVTTSNKVRFKEKLSKRVESSFHQTDFIFDPYDATQLCQILKNRRDAFREGVLAEGAIEKCAALSAQEHGDARKAIVVLKAAGEAAERAGDSMVTERHIEDAAGYAEVDRIKELISGDTPQAKAVLYALAALHILHDEQEAFTTKETYNFYQRICDTCGLSALGYNRAYGLLKEHNFFEIIDSERTNVSGQRAERTHWLTVDPEVVLQAVLETERSSLSGLASLDELKHRAEDENRSLDLTHEEGTQSTLPGQPDT
jgi:cell division control protein 6